ncbi:MAG TPA: hypothetical protein VGJ20_03080 [Xanthobacteraceae bacterium]
MPKKWKAPTAQRTTSILIEAGESEGAALSASQFAYADACNLLVSVAVETRCWNRYGLRAPA